MTERIVDSAQYFLLLLLFLRLSGKQDDSLERQSDSSESWSDILERQEF